MSLELVVVVLTNNIFRYNLTLENCILPRFAHQAGIYPC